MIKLFIKEHSQFQGTVEPRNMSNLEQIWKKWRCFESHQTISCNSTNENLVDDFETKNISYSMPYLKFKYSVKAPQKIPFRPGICVKCFLWFPQKTSHQRISHNTKLSIFSKLKVSKFSKSFIAVLSFFHILLSM